MALATKPPPPDESAAASHTPPPRKAIKPPVPPFPNMTQIPSKLTVPMWQIVRLLSLASALGIAFLLIVDEHDGLFVFWRIVIPLLPVTFMVAPGLWRNICPLAASNQTPRVLNITYAKVAPKWLKNNAFLISCVLFISFVCLRKVGLDDSGPWTAILLLGAMASGFAGGMLFKGKSGWCSSLCPLLPVQRVYNQTPFVLVGNSHCNPCVGCTKNCYDFNPKVANMADLSDSDEQWSGRRRLFAAALPGLIWAFFHVHEVDSAHSAGSVYGEVALAVAVALGAWFVLEQVVKLSSHTQLTLFGAAAFSIFYWFGGPVFVSGVIDGPVSDPAQYVIRAAFIALALVWVYRSFEKEKAFKAQNAPAAGSGATGSLSVIASNTLLTQSRKTLGNPEVTFEPTGKRVVAEPKATLLDLAEKNGVTIEAGCRMGVCGADPVVIISGEEHLNKVGADEKNTLERLGLGPACRMACQARLKGTGPVKCSTDPNAAPDNKRPPTKIPTFVFDKSVEKVVVIGNGIAGVTAADHVRRRHPLAAIDVIADEPHPLYNRMGIARLVYGRSAMQGLHLNPDKWYSDRAITTWLNTSAVSIDRSARMVRMGTGETLPYDRLIMANGSAAMVPSINGFGADGTFVMRTAADALELRAFVQRHSARRAVVAGGGLLGLEGAYALHKLGLRAAVLERGDRLLRRQLDARASAILRAYLEGLGMAIVLKAETASVASNGRLRSMLLSDGRKIRADVLLVAAGIVPNIDLASAAGLTVRRGIVVDDHMRSSDPFVFAAGDCAEIDGSVAGLWPAAVEQAEVAAVNAVGGDRAYQGTIPVTALKVAGIDLNSLGQFEPESDRDEVISFVEDGGQAYRKLVVCDGIIVGGILIGRPGESPGVTAAVKTSRDVSSLLPALRAGDWSGLAPDDD